jgi:DNA-binding response OmpR family regulator
MKRQAKVFVVEDDPGLAKVLTFHLTQLGYTVCGTTGYGEGALEKIRTVMPDVVLLDVRLAGRMSGIEVGELLAYQTDIPFIYLSSLADRETLLRAGSTVPEGYLRKPYDTEQLRITIEMALNR